MKSLTQAQKEHLVSFFPDTIFTGVDGRKSSRELVLASSIAVDKNLLSKPNTEFSHQFCVGLKEGEWDFLNRCGWDKSPAECGYEIVVTLPLLPRGPLLGSLINHGFTSY